MATGLARAERTRDPPTSVILPDPNPVTPPAARETVSSLNPNRSSGTVPQGWRVVAQNEFARGEGRGVDAQSFRPGSAALRSLAATGGPADRRDWPDGGRFDLADLAAGSATPVLGSSFGRAKSCIVLFLMGGPPQHSTWDPKPDAPAEVRGEFKPIATAVPGMSICELMPRTALARRQALHPPRRVDRRQRPFVQRLLHDDGPAARADELRERQPRAARTTGPAWGRSCGGSERSDGGCPPTVTLPHRIFNTDGSVWPGQDAGFSGRLGRSVAAQRQRPTPDVPHPGVQPARRLVPAALAERQTCSTRSDQRLDVVDRGAAGRRCSTLTAQAFDLLRSAEARQAFQLERGARGDPRPLRRDAIRPERAAGAPAGRGGRAAGAGQLVPRPGRAARRTPAGTATPSEAARLKDVLVPPMDQASRR